MQRSALCRSRRELSNEYLLAKIGVDTAENEPLEIWGKIIQYYPFVSLVAKNVCILFMNDSCYESCSDAHLWSHGEPAEITKKKP